MKNKPIISVIASAYRTNFWMEIYNSFFNAKISFEIVFVGHVKPNFDLPENFKFIYTEVKPAQCWEIAARKAKGKFIATIADDCVFCDGYLDILYKNMMNLFKKRKKVILSSIQIKENRTPIPYEKYCFWYGDKKSPRLPMGIMLKRKDWIRLGGIDRNFIAMFGDFDLALRMIEDGGKLFFCKEATFFERNRKRVFGKSLGHTDVHKKDGETFRKFWNKKIIFINYSEFKRHRKKFCRIFKSLKKEKYRKEYMILEKKLLKKEHKFFKKYGINDPLNILYVNKEKGIIFKKRLCSVEPFNDKEILFFSQGKKDNKWE